MTMFTRMFRRARHRDRSKAQGLVEFVLVFPVILLLTMVAVDFGRVYLGWVNLQSMARIAANFAANNASEFATGDAPTITKYENQVLNDATANNCQLLDSAGDPTTTPPPPVFSGYEIGDTVTVGFDCSFTILTPIIQNIFGDNGTLTVSASSAFPVKVAIVAANNNGGGGGGGGGEVAAHFSCTPKTGPLDLLVSCSDESGGNPNSWAWVVEKNGVEMFVSGEQDPEFLLIEAGIYDVTLTVDNDLNVPDTFTRLTYLNTSDPSEVDFTADVNTGPAPLLVNFTDNSTNTPLTWAWDVDGNGSTDYTTQNPSHTYTAAGTYNVTLTVTNAAGPATPLTKNGFIVVDPPNCNVPSFTGDRRNAAHQEWEDAQFDPLNFHDRPGAPNGNYIIQFQSITPGTVVPCTSVIEVDD